MHMHTNQLTLSAGFLCCLLTNSTARFSWFSSFKCLDLAPMSKMVAGGLFSKPKKPEQLEVRKPNWIILAGFETKC